jgi:hypothetical protein
MHASLNITSPSPDRQHTARLIVGGEIRHGPLYFGLEVDAWAFGRRIFGAAHVWSPASTLLAVQEWLTLDYAEGPITALVLIDLAQGCETTLARAIKGFVVPEAFAGSILSFRITYAGQDAQHRQFDTATVKDWTALS